MTRSAGVPAEAVEAKIARVATTPVIARTAPRRRRRPREANNKNVSAPTRVRARTSRAELFARASAAAHAPNPVNRARAAAATPAIDRVAVIPAIASPPRSANANLTAMGRRRRPPPLPMRTLRLSGEIPTTRRRPLRRPPKAERNALASTMTTAFGPCAVRAVVAIAVVAIAAPIAPLKVRALAPLRCSTAWDSRFGSVPRFF